MYLVIVIKFEVNQQDEFDSGVVTVFNVSYKFYRAKHLIKLNTNK